MNLPKWVVASGALGWDGNGWLWERPLVKLGIIDPSLFLITTKTLTLFPKRGNWFAVRPKRGGVWNNMGLPNKGLDWWLRTYKGLDYPRYGGLIGRKKLPYKTLLSIAPFCHNEADRMCSRIVKEGLIRDINFFGVELNVSCPNTNSLEFDEIYRIVETTRKYLGSDFAVVIKLNAVQAFTYHWGTIDEEQLMKLRPLCDAVSINSIPQLYKAGAVSGQIAQPINWSFAKYLKNLGFKVIVPSVWEYNDLAKVLAIGDAVSFGSIHLLRPWAPTQYVRRYEREHA